MAKGVMKRPFQVWRFAQTSKEDAQETRLHFCDPSSEEKIMKNPFDGRAQKTIARCPSGTKLPRRMPDAFTRTRAALDTRLSTLAP
jgi:hypothetical protein